MLLRRHLAAASSSAQAKLSNTRTALSRSLRNPPSQEEHRDACRPPQTPDPHHPTMQRLLTSSRQFLPVAQRAGGGLAELQPAGWPEA